MTTTPPRRPLPTQPIEPDAVGCPRFRENKLVRFLLDAGGKVTLNDLVRLPVDDDDKVQFAQLIGYSLAGFGELSFVTDEAYDRAEREGAPPSDAAEDPASKPRPPRALVIELAELEGALRRVIPGYWKDGSQRTDDAGARAVVEAARNAPDVQRLALGPDDALVVSFPGHVTDETAERLRHLFESRMPGRKIYVFGDGGTVKVLAAEKPTPPASIAVQLPELEAALRRCVPGLWTGVTMRIDKEGVRELAEHVWLELSAGIFTEVTTMADDRRVVE